MLEVCIVDASRLARRDRLAAPVGSRRIPDRMVSVHLKLFTGKKAFEGKTFSEMLRKHRDERPPDPSSLVPNLDLAVEGTILRCIAKDSAARPASALAVHVRRCRSTS
jgi:hypothetical protein